MGRQTTDFGIELRQFAFVGSFQFGDRVTALEQIGQPLESCELPFAQDGHSNSMLRSQLSEGFGFLQQLQNDLGFEAGSVRLFHTTILPNPGRLGVQIIGSTIQFLVHTVGGK